MHRIQEQEGKLQALVEFSQRFRIDRVVAKAAPFASEVQYLPAPASAGA